MGVEEPLEEGSQVDVTIFPSTDRRDLMGCAKDPRYRSGYEIPFCLVGGLVKKDEAARLRTALSLIGKFQGLGASESLAFLVHYFLLIVDCYRSSQGLESLLRGPTKGEVDTSTKAARRRYLKEMNRPLFPVNALIDFWEACGGTIADARIYTSPDSESGRPSYFHIPPVWLTPDKIEEIGRLDSAPTNVPVVVKSSLASLVGKFARFYEEHDGVTGAPAIQFLASPGVAMRGTSPDSWPAIQLSESQLVEFRQHGFKSSLGIQVTGQTAGRKSNVVLIDGRTVRVPDSLFRLFLRLVVAVFERDDGFISRTETKQGADATGEGALAHDGLDQAVSHLRDRFRPALGGLEGTDFIEFNRGQLRLSTHRAYIAVKREALLSHPDDVVRDLAGRLPEQ